MGVRAAYELLDFLNMQGALNQDTLDNCVLEALYDPDLHVGSQAYRRLERRAFIEGSRVQRARENDTYQGSEQFSPETSAVLEKIFSEAAGEDSDFGFYAGSNASEEAEREALAALGQAADYLGVERDMYGGLSVDPRTALGMQRDEEESEYRDRMKGREKEKPGRSGPPPRPRFDTGPAEPPRHPEDGPLPRPKDGPPPRPKDG